MRRLSLFLTLLMVLAPMTTMIPALEESTPKLESYEATNGWGESLAYEVIEYDGIDWEVMPTRGVNTWIGNAISNFSDSVDDLDVAIGPDQVVKACGYNTDTQDLEVYTLTPDGTTSRDTVDSPTSMQMHLPSKWPEKAITLLQTDIFGWFEPWSMM